MKKSVKISCKNRPKIQKKTWKSVPENVLFFNIDFCGFWPPFCLPKWLKISGTFWIFSYFLSDRRQERSRSSQDRPKTAQEGPKSAQDRPKSAPRAIQKRPKERPGMHIASPKRPRAPQERPGGKRQKKPPSYWKATVQEGQERPRATQETPRRP